MSGNWASSAASVLATVLVVLPAAVPAAFGFRRWDSWSPSRGGSWIAPAMGALLGALVAICAHGLCQSLGLAHGAGPALAAWCVGYVVAWLAIGAVLLLARRFRSRWRRPWAHRHAPSRR